MKPTYMILGVLGVGSVAGVSFAASRYEPVAAPGTQVGQVPIAGLTKAEAAKKVRLWWNTERMRQVTLTLPEARKDFSARPSQLGVVVDDTASVDQVHFRDFWESAKSLVDKNATGKKYEVKFVSMGKPTVDLASFVEDNVESPRPARVVYANGKIERFPEVAGRELDTEKLGEAVIAALRGDDTAVIPVRESKKTISDEDLAQIEEIRTEYTTKFSEGKVSRSSNIRTAAKSIDGLVLAPGQRFSFNKTVGRRSAATGFKEAGVYKNGKHDVDFGGGICQVSSTLYNAALIADLKIPVRTNHSMPVPYVPLGRDATVDYYGADLQIENNLEKPIAISVSVNSGSITFRILGKKDPSLSVKMVSGGASSWGTGQQTIQDPSLPQGRTKVIEKGCSGHSINTWRVVYRDGVEVRRDALGQSYYRGAKRIIAVGTAPSASASPDVAPIPENAPPTLPDEHDGF